MPASNCCVQVGKDLKPSHRRDFKYLHLEADDYPWQDVRKFFAEAFSFIEEARQTGVPLQKASTLLEAQQTDALDIQHY